MPMRLIDDLTLDVLIVLRQRLEVLQAYDKYLSDAEDDAELRDLFVQMRRRDEEHVMVLKEALARRLDEELGFEEELDEEEDEDEEEGGELAEVRPRRGESTQRRV